MWVTGLYTALLTLLALVLAGCVVARRWQTQTGIGSGGDEALARYQRTHANLLENAPLALLLLLALELGGVQPWLLHLFGIVLVVARLLHAWGLSHSAGTSVGRMLGIVFTWLVMLAMIVLVLWRHVAALL